MAKMTSNALGKIFAEAGIITEEQYSCCRRIVVDIQANSLPIIYLELSADDKLLSVVQTLHGIEIKREGKPDGYDTRGI